MGKEDRPNTKNVNNTMLKTLLIMSLVVTALLSFICFKSNNILELYREKYNSECVSAMMIMKSNHSLTENSNSYKNQSQILSVENKGLKQQNEKIKKEMEALKEKNQQLEAAKKALSGDNLELQKSLKKAASVGVTPQSYNYYSEDALKTTITKGKYLGKFLGTAYTPSSEECGNNRGITSSGLPIVPGVSIAVDKSHWPYGTVFYIKGLGYTVAMDTGSAIKGEKRFDFAVFDKKFAYELGEEYYDVYLVKLGNGKIDESILS